jgi:adenylate cyclase
VAREQELADLETHLRSARNGNGHVVFVTGEAGSGKTTLVQEFSRRAQETHPDMIVVAASCHSYHGLGDPFLPFRQILRLLTGGVEAPSAAGLLSRDHVLRLWHLWPQAVEALVAHGPVLIDTFVPARFLIERATTHLSTVPGWLVQLHELMARKPVQASGQGLQQRVIFDEYSAVLAVLATQQPLLLILDDLHWADLSSLSLLFHLARCLGRSRVLIAATYRPEEMFLSHTGDPHLLPGLVAEFRRTYGKIGVDLDEAKEVEGRRFLDALLDDEPNRLGEEFRQALFRHTEGHALFAVELLRDLQERGDLRQDEAGRWVDEPTLAWDMLPARIEGVIEKRMGRLEKRQRAILSAASVEGEIFTAQVIASVQGMGETPLLRLLSQELEKHHRLVQERAEIRVREQYLSRYRFAHVLFQQYLYNQLGAGERRRLHAEIGTTLEALYGDESAENAVPLAYHFTQAEIWDKAFHYLRTAGDRARQTYAAHEAIAFYTQALAVSHHMAPAPGPADLLPVYEERALVHMLLTQYDEAITDFQKMGQLARASLNRQKEGESLSHLAYVHWLTFSAQTTPLVEAYAQEALELARQTGDSRSLAQSFVRLGSVDQVRGDMLEADRKFNHAMQISLQEGYRDSLAQSLEFLSMQRYLQADYQQAIQFGREGLAIFREFHDGFNELRTLSFLCQSLWGAGEYARAFSLLHEGMVKAQEMENRFFVGRLLNTLGWYYREFGDMARAVENDLESVELGRMTNISNVEISALVNLGLDHLALGQTAQARAYMEPTLERVQREAFGAHKWRWQMKLLLGLAEVHYATAEYEPALGYMQAGIAEAQATFSHKYVAHGRALRGRLMLTLGQTQAAGRELEQAFTLAEQLHSPALVYPLAYELGWWHESIGQVEAAANLYIKAKAAVASMSTAVEDDVLRSTLLQSVLVQAIESGLARTG